MFTLESMYIIFFERIDASTILMGLDFMYSLFTTDHGKMKRRHYMYTSFCPRKYVHEKEPNSSEVIQLIALWTYFLTYIVILLME